MTPRSRELLAAIAAIVVTRLAALPRSTWEFDETLFYRALERYDPLSHFPPPPGYPLYILTGKLFRLILGDPFVTLVTISTIASIAGFVVMAFAFARIAGDERMGIAGALLFHFSPGMLLHSTLPISDPGALALYAAAIWFSARAAGWKRTAVAEDESAGRMPADRPAGMPALLGSPASGRRDAILFAVFAALTVGWRSQLAIAILPLLFVAIALMRTWRDRFVALGAFTIVCVLWLIPLTMAVGGVEKLIAFETRQAAYFAEHDADVSRSGWTPPRIALRFIAHPWGPKLLSTPLLLAALLGIAVLVIRRRRELLPLAASFAVYLGVALAIMDPADGVRYALPSVVTVAFFAGVGLVFAASKISKELSAYAIVAVFAAGSMVYLSPILSQRRASDAPPMRAIAYAKQTFPKNAVALYELPLWPHATYYLKDYRPKRVDVGLREYYDDPDVPLFILADGVTYAPEARTFRWRPSDAYSKLTRNHYRVASVIPLPPNRRFGPLFGIYAPEREPDGGEWRWLMQKAELRLPPIPATTLRLRVGLPVIYPLEGNSLTVRLGATSQTVALTRGVSTELRMAIPAGVDIVRLEAARSFVPAELPGSLNRDPRRLAVKLYDFQVD